MPILSAYLRGRLKRQRAKAWTRTFVLRTMPTAYADPLDPYSAIVGTPTDVTLYGDWLWRDQNTMVGGAGGMMNAADVVLNADLAHSGSFVIGVHRMVLEGIECSIDRITPYFTSGEILVEGTKVGL